MSAPINQISAVVYLAALAITSLPVTVGLLGWCPCGCLPEALVPYSYPSAGSDSAPPASGHEEGHDSHHCRGCHGLPYCPMLGEPPQVEWADAGALAVESTDLLPPAHFVRLIRPPRA